MDPAQQGQKVLDFKGIPPRYWYSPRVFPIYKPDRHLMGIVNHNL